MAFMIHASLVLALSVPFMASVHAVELKPHTADTRAQVVTVSSDASIKAAEEKAMMPQELANAAAAAAEALEPEVKVDIDKDAEAILRHFAFLKETVKRLGRERRAKQAARSEPKPHASLMQSQEGQYPGASGGYGASGGNGASGGYGARSGYGAGASAGGVITAESITAQQLTQDPTYQEGYYTGWNQGYLKGVVAAHKDLNATKNGANISVRNKMTAAEKKQLEGNIEALNHVVVSNEAAMGLPPKIISYQQPAKADSSGDTTLYLILGISIFVVISVSICLALVGLVAMERHYKHQEEVKKLKEQLQQEHKANLS